MLLSLTDYRPSARYDAKSWTSARVDGSANSTGPWAEIQSFDLLPDVNPSAPVGRSFTLEDVASDVAYLRVVFLDADGGEDLTDAIPVAPAIGNLTTVRNVRVRLGRDLTDDELTQIDYLITLGTISIFASLNMPSTWQPASTALPFLGLLNTEVVCRGMVNPGQLFQRSESIGSYSYSELYTPRGEKSVPGLFLTPAEELVLRRTVFGTNTGSVKVDSFADFYADTIWPMSVAYGLYYLNAGETPFVWK